MFCGICSEKNYMITIKMKYNCIFKAFYHLKPNPFPHHNTQTMNNLVVTANVYFEI